MGLKAVGDAQYADVVKECLDVRYLDPDGPAPPPVGENGQADDEDDAAAADEGLHEALDARVKAMESFMPTVATIPSTKEAQSIAR